MITYRFTHICNYKPPVHAAVILTIGKPSLYMLEFRVRSENVCVGYTHLYR